MRKLLLVILLVVFSLLVGCNSDSGLKNGQSLVLSNDTPVCTSRDAVDRVINYVKNNNESGLKTMEKMGEAMILPKGTKINIVDYGIVTKIQTSSGYTFYAPKEVLK